MSTIRRSVTTVGSLYALMRQMLRLNVKTPLLTQEISATSTPDRPLVVSTLTPIAGWPVDHGTVADEAAMLALHTLDSTTLLTEPTFVAPGDSCLRADDPDWRWHCIAGHGQALSDWERRPLAGALSGLAVSGHTHAMSAITGLQTALEALDSAVGAVATTANAAAPLASPALTGEPTAPTPAASDSSTRLATTAMVQAAIAAGGGGGGTEVSPIAYGEIDWGGTDYTYVSDGDANGIFYALGREAGGGAWVNPNGLTLIVTAYGGGGALYGLADREANDSYAKDGGSPGVSWIAVDLGALWQVQCTRYSIRGNAVGSNLPRHWILQGSIDNSTWANLDERADSSIGASTWGTFEVSAGSGYYRYFRLLCAGADGSGAYRMRVGEWELYGRRLATTAPENPAWANTWMTDDDGHYWPAYATG